MIDPDMKYMDIKEFHERGYLQEVNRLFFHPRGLALEVIVNDYTGVANLLGIRDHRDDPEGVYFGNLDQAKSREKIEIQRAIVFERYKPRVDALGFWVEPPAGGVEQ